MFTKALDIALLKDSAHRLGAISIVQKAKSLVVVLTPDSTVSPDKLTEEVRKNRGRLFFTTAANPCLTYKTNDEETNSIMQLRRILDEIGA